MSKNKTIDKSIISHGKYELPDFPRLIFLDTNVVQYLETFGQYIYDHYLGAYEQQKLELLSRRSVEDVEALAAIMDLGRRNGWPLAVSQRTLDELSATPEPNKRYSLLQWGGELAEYSNENYRRVSSIGNQSIREPLSHLQKSYLEKLLDFLPQSSDRLLVIDAIELGCDFFITMDYRTILK